MDTTVEAEAEAGAEVEMGVGVEAEAEAEAEAKAEVKAVDAEAGAEMKLDKAFTGVVYFRDEHGEDTATRNVYTEACVHVNDTRAEMRIVVYETRCFRACLSKPRDRFLCFTFAHRFDNEVRGLIMQCVLDPHACESVAKGQPGLMFFACQPAPRTMHPVVFHTRKKGCKHYLTGATVSMARAEWDAVIANARAFMEGCATQCGPTDVYEQIARRKAKRMRRELELDKSAAGEQDVGLLARREQ